MKLLQSLSHPNVIQCYGAYVETRNKPHLFQLFIVLERMQYSLSDYYIHFGRITAVPQLAFIASEVLKGLKYIHEQGY